jgi:dephospho-CoA kinase
MGSSSSPQRRIGLTGGIASGKSSVGRWLAEQGIPVLDADLYAREALAPNSLGALAVAKRYGPAVLAPGNTDGRVTLDRAALGRIVFTSPAERQWLEGVVHPLVRARFAEELNRLATAPVVVLMIPLLFEAGLESLCTETWLVTCSEAQQLERLMARDGLSEADALARIKAQWPLSHKQPLASLIIDNGQQMKAWSETVRKALQRQR